jgi:hypothetical protein
MDGKCGAHRTDVADRKIRPKTLKGRNDMGQAEVGRRRELI